MFIVNPLSGRSFASLFSTHPPIEERIARLTGDRYFPDNAGNGPSQRTGRQEAEDSWKRLMR